MVLLHAEQRCNVVRRIGAEIDSVASVVHKCEISISVNPLTVYIAELTVNTRTGMLFRGISSMRFQKTIAAFVAIVGISSSALGQNTDNYPRLGTYMIGGAQKYDSGYQTYAAKIHVNVINGAWPGWEASRGYSKQTVISSIKAQSKINSRVIQYTLANGANLVAANDANPIIASKVASMNWWLYVSGTSGTIALADSSDGYVNMTAAAPLDPTTGLAPYPWSAKYFNDMYHLGAYEPGSGTSAAPSLDGIMLDNVFWEPRVDGDWLRNGTTQLATNSTTQPNFRTGEKAWFDYLLSIWSSGIRMGNTADWFRGNGANSVLPFSSSGPMNAGLYEGAIGASYSVDTNIGSAQMQQQYQFQINNLAAPKYLIFSHDNVTFTGSDNYGPNWQAMRYGITAALMNNGYYYANTNGSLQDETAANRLWFDEYDGGGLGVGYLGQPLSNAAGAVQTVAWSNGVWKREFANGIVLWNPKGNGQQTISLSGLGNLKHFSGSQNPSLNNGATVTNGSVTLQDRDGLILMRLTPVAIPDPPTAVQIQ
jgi:hypothetical protein